MFKNMQQKVVGAVTAFVVLAIALAMFGNARAAQGVDQIAQAKAANVQLSAPASGVNDPGPGVTTYTGGPAADTFSPANRYLANGGKVTLHYNLTAEDAAKASVSFDIADATKISVVSAITSVNGDVLSMSASNNTITLTSDIGRPLGPIVLVTFKANTGAEGLIFGYSSADGVATLSGPAFTTYNIKNSAGVVMLGTVCYAYDPSDRSAPKATLTLIESTNVSSVTSYDGFDLKPTVDSTTHVLTVENPRGYALGGPVQLCVSAAAPNKPFGVAKQPVVPPASIPVP